MGKTKEKTTKKPIQTITTILFVLVILLCLPLAVPRCFGLTPYDVVSGSMTPYLPVGSVVYAKQVDTDSLAVGDVIVFEGAIADSGVITHRILAVDTENRQFTTKGDANSTADVNPVAYDHVQGKVVFHLPVLGAIYEVLFVGNHKLILLAVFVLMLVLTLIESVLQGAKAGNASAASTDSNKKDVEVLDLNEDEDSVSEDDLDGKPKKKSHLMDILIIVLALVLIIGGGLGMFLYQKDYNDSNDLYSGLEEEYVSYVAPAHEGQDTEETEQEWYELIDVDFQNLMATNSDTCGWLYLENEDLSYPIMYSGDNETYLRTGYDGKAATAGSIFLDEDNSFDFSDSHSIIYGHNMRNLSMFGKLKYYNTDEDYYENHKYFQILTPLVKYRYEIFAYEDVTEDSYIYTVPFGDTEEFEEFLSKIQRSSQRDTDVTVTQADHVVTLSTCSTTGRRFVVHGVLVDAYLVEE